MQESKTIFWTRHGDVTVVRFKTRMVTEAENLCEAYEDLKNLAETVSGKILISLSNVEFISSAGISAFVWLHEFLLSRGGQLRICDAKPSVYDAFTVGHLHSVLQFHGKEFEAIAAFQNASPA